MSDEEIAAFEAVQQEIKPGEERLDALRRLGRELVKTEKEIEDMSATIAPKAARANFLKNKLIPDLMSSLELEDFTFRDGSKIKVVDFVSGSLPKDPEKRSEALKLVEEYGAEGIIKNNITVAFQRRQHNEALALAADLKEKGYDAETKSDIHPQTLMAFVRERLAKGEDVDAPALGCFVGRVAKIEVSAATKAALAANRRKF
jgi:hypothetical protein